MNYFFRKIRVRTRRRRRVRANNPQYTAQKAAARALAIERLEHFRVLYTGLDPELATHMAYKRIAIRDQRSRWGSCSSKKNLNFNYRIVELAPDLRDYIIVHELCHLKELHHGEAFWQLMERVIPRAREFHHVARSMRIS